VVSLGKEHAADAAACGEEFLLDFGAGGGGVGIAEVFVVEVMTGGAGGGVIADGQPGLGFGAFGEVVGCVSATHFGGYPAGVDGV